MYIGLDIKGLGLIFSEGLLGANLTPGPSPCGEGSKFIARQIAELCLESPRNSTAAVCREIRARWGNHAAGVFVYGDPSGKAASPLTDGRTNHYDVIRRELAQMRPTLRVEQAAPAVGARGLFINDVFAGAVEDVRIMIDPGCTRTLQDYQNVQEAADGGKHKQMSRDATTGVRSQALGHCSDANDYLLCSAFKRAWRAHQRSGKMLPPAEFGERTYY